MRYSPSAWTAPSKATAEATNRFPHQRQRSRTHRRERAGRCSVNSQREGAMGLALTRTSAFYIATATRRTDRGRLYAVEPANRDRLRSHHARRRAVISAVLIDPKSNAIILATSPAGRVIRVGPTFGLSPHMSVKNKTSQARSGASGSTPTFHAARGSSSDSKWKHAQSTTKPGAHGQSGHRARRRRHQRHTWALHCSSRPSLHAANNAKAPCSSRSTPRLFAITSPRKSARCFILRRGVQLEALPVEGEQDKTIQC